MIVDEQLVWVRVEIAVVGAVASSGDGVARAGVVARGGVVAVPGAAADRVSIMRRLAREIARPRGVVAVARFAQDAAPGVGARARCDAARHRARAVVLTRAILAPATGQRTGAGAVGQYETDVAVDPGARERIKRGPRRRVHDCKVHHGVD